MATIKTLKFLKLMQLVVANEVLKWPSVKLSPLELNIKQFSMCDNFFIYPLNHGTVFFFFFFFFLSLSYSLNCTIVIVEENLFFQ